MMHQIAGELIKPVEISLMQLQIMDNSVQRVLFEEFIWKCMYMAIQIMPLLEHLVLLPNVCLLLINNMHNMCICK